MIGRWASLLLAAVLGSLATETSATPADTCPPLQIVASVPMTYDITGRPLVPVTLGAAHELMLADTGGTFSAISRQAVTEFGLPRHKVPVRQYNVSGKYTDQAADVSPFAVGRLVANHVALMIDPDPWKFSRGREAGIIGANILRNYDVEFDFGANTFKLISPDHCRGKVIYWPAASAAAIPMRVAKVFGHVFVPVMLEGVVLNALVDTGASTSFIPSRTAENDFALKPGSPDTPAAGLLQGTTGTPIYRHRFRSLSLQGIVVHNLTVAVIPDLTPNATFGGRGSGTRLAANDEAQGFPDVTLGVDVLKYLHLYIAYKEQMLYVTPAEAPTGRTGIPAPSGAGATARSASPH